MLREGAKSQIVGAQEIMRNLYVEAVQPVDLNKNTSWFQYPGVWTIYIFILFFSWLVILSLLGCTAGTAWTIVHLAHFAVRWINLRIWICFNLKSNSLAVYYENLITLTAFFTPNPKIFSNYLCHWWILKTNLACRTVIILLPYLSGFQFSTWNDQAYVN